MYRDQSPLSDCPQDTPWTQADLDRTARISLISAHLTDMGHALAGEVDQVLVAEFMLLSNRLERLLEREHKPPAFGA